MGNCISRIFKSFIYRLFYTSSGWRSSPKLTGVHLDPTTHEYKQRSISNYQFLKNNRILQLRVVISNPWNDRPTPPHNKKTEQNPSNHTCEDNQSKFPCSKISIFARSSTLSRRNMQHLLTYQRIVHALTHAAISTVAVFVLQTYHSFATMSTQRVKIRADATFSSTVRGTA